MPDSPTSKDIAKPEAIIALGSNIGDRIGYFERALRLLLKDGNSVLIECSQWYETDPVEGLEGQGFCLNSAIAINTKHDPESLLKQLLAIEKALGRERGDKKSPRTIDLDLILFESEQIQTDAPELPHPRFRQRSFVLCPLRDLLKSKALKSEYWTPLKKEYQDYDSEKGINGSLPPSPLFLKACIPS